MEFAVPWERLTVSDVQYGLSQINTRIENGLFIPVYYANRDIRCQALHLLSPSILITDRIDANSVGTFITVRIPHDSEFGKKLQDLDNQNIQHAILHKTSWGSQRLNYKSSLSQLPDGDLDWRIQIPDSGVFSCFDTQRKSWFASNESGLTKTRTWRILARSSGLWVDPVGFGMDWKLIGAFVD
jgi:hypothetical protein